MSFDLYLTKEPFTDMHSKHSLWNSGFLSVTQCNKRLFHRETQRTDGATQRKEHLRPKDPADGTLCFSVSLRVIKGHLKEWKKPIIEKEKLHGKQNDPASGRQP